MNLLEELIDLLARPPRAERISSIQASVQFKKLHAKATKYVRSSKRTNTQTASLISELKEYQ